MANGSRYSRNSAPPEPFAQVMQGVVAWIDSKTNPPCRNDLRRPGSATSNNQEAAGGSCPSAVNLGGALPTSAAWRASRDRGAPRQGVGQALKGPLAVPAQFA